MEPSSHLLVDNDCLFLNFTLRGVKVELSSQYKIRRGNRENKVLASKQNLNNESEEGTKITV